MEASENAGQSLDSAQEACIPVMLRLKLALLRIMARLLVSGPRRYVGGNADPTSVLVQVWCWRQVRDATPP